MLLPCSFSPRALSSWCYCFASPWKDTLQGCKAFGGVLVAVCVVFFQSQLWYFVIRHQQTSTCVKQNRNVSHAAWLVLFRQRHHWHTWTTALEKPTKTTKKNETESKTTENTCCPWKSDGSFSFWLVVICCRVSRGDDSFLVDQLNEITVREPVNCMLRTSAKTSLHANFHSFFFIWSIFLASGFQIRWSSTGTTNNTKGICVVRLNIVRKNGSVLW